MHSKLQEPTFKLTSVKWNATPKYFCFKPLSVKWKFHFTDEDLKQKHLETVEFDIAL